MFADTDFILALIKDSDWLKDKANKVFEEYKEKIKTSISVMIEIALLCKKFNREVFRTFSDISEMIKIEEDAYNICLRASTYIDKDNLNVFDAFHAAYCFGDTIISSDSVYDKIGIKRLKLEDV